MQRRTWLKPVDIISTAFIALLLGLTLIYYGRIPLARLIAGRYMAAVVLVAGAAILHHRNRNNRLFSYFHEFLPLFIVPFVFDSLCGLTHYVNPADMDPALARLDEAIFGAAPGALMEGLINPALTTVLQLCYTSYYFLPVVLCIILYFGRDRAGFDTSVFGIVLGFFLSYAGYLMVPALGPRFYLDGVYNHDLMRGGLAAAIDGTLNNLEGRNRDAFPSGHTEMVLIVLYYAWIYRRWYFWAALPLVAGLIFSTVYLRYHYAVDVFAGMALAAVTVIASRALHKALSGGPGEA